MVNSFVMRLSNGVVGIERFLVGVFSALVFGLVTLGMFARYFGSPIYWIDEAATLAMVAMSFIGASLVTRLKREFAVTLLLDYGPPGIVRAARIAIALIGLVFALILVGLAWSMFDPLTLQAFDFDIRKFSVATGNFLYLERSTTLEVPRFVFYLVIPVYAVFLVIHTLANLFEAVTGTQNMPDTPGAEASSSVVS